MKKCRKCAVAHGGEEQVCTNCGSSLPQSKSALVGRWLSGTGCLIGFSPFIFSLISGIWAGSGFIAILTLPIGAVVSLVGLALWLSNRNKK
jgi:hypothetical protein